MHASTAIRPLSAPGQETTRSASNRRITRAEMVWLGVAAVLLTVSSLDAVSEIPPLADDYWMIARAPGEIALEYFRDYGWGRPLGMWLLDLINTVRAATEASLLAVILVMRVAILAAVYFTLRRVYAFSPGAALLSVAVMAWNPPASEAWVLLCNLHLAVSVVPALVACGLYARALGSLPGPSESDGRVGTSGRVLWRLVIAGAAVQVGGNLIYEQALLAVPAFVAVLSVLGRGRSIPRLSRVSVLGVTTGVALVCVVAMFATGYVSSRSQGTTSNAAELTDLGAALHALWIGFGQHHLWRIIEAVRAQSLWSWDVSLLGGVALAATVAASVIVAWRLVRDRSERASSANVGLAAAALAAAYATLLPIGFAYPGYTIVSRLYYLPGAFVALALAALAPSQWRVPRVALGVGAGAAMLWLGIVTRRYYEDMRQGTRILRVVARSIAQVPPPIRAGGLLVIAPSNVGTFATGVVEPWSLRPAVRYLTGVDPEGPLLIVTDCAELAREKPRMTGDIDRPRWAAVLKYRSGRVEVNPSIRAACAS